MNVSNLLSLICCYATAVVDAASPHASLIHRRFLIHLAQCRRHPSRTSRKHAAFTVTLLLPTRSSTQANVAFTVNFVRRRRAARRDADTRPRRYRSDAQPPHVAYQSRSDSRPPFACRCHAVKIKCRRVARRETTIGFTGPSSRESSTWAGIIRDAIGTSRIEYLHVAARRTAKEGLGTRYHQAGEMTPAHTGRRLASSGRKPRPQPRKQFGAIRTGRSGSREVVNRLSRNAASRLAFIDKRRQRSTPVVELAQAKTPPAVAHAEYVANYVQPRCSVFAR